MVEWESKSIGFLFPRQRIICENMIIYLWLQDFHIFDFTIVNGICNKQIYKIVILKSLILNILVWVELQLCYWFKNLIFFNGYDNVIGRYFDIQTWNTLFFVVKWFSFSCNEFNNKFENHDFSHLIDVKFYAYISYLFSLKSIHQITNNNK